MSTSLISGPMQAVEDKRKLEKHMGSKKLSTVTVLGCPIPDLRRRTSVAKSHITWHSNVDRSLYYGNNNRYLRVEYIKGQRGTNQTIFVLSCGGRI